MSIFFKRSISLLTKHGKDGVIGEVLHEKISCKLIHTDAYDTDLLGTFTQETPRYGTQLDTARKKALIGIDLLKTDLGLANEGVFTNDPYAGVIPWNNELIVLIDQQYQLEITGYSSGPAQNETGYISHWEDLKKFADSAKFPSHYLVIKPTDEYHSQSRKGIQDLAEFKQAFEWSKAYLQEGLCMSKMICVHLPTPLAWKIFAKLPST